MDFSVGIAVLVLVTVLVVAVIGYGIYLNRRHDHWESVVGQTAIDGQSSGLGAGEHLVPGKASKNRIKRNSGTTGRHTGTKRDRSKRLERGSPIVAGAPASAKKAIESDQPGLPLMGIDDVYRGGIDTAGGKIIKHETKPRRSSEDVFGAEERQTLPIRPKIDALSDEFLPCTGDEMAPDTETTDGIVGEVRTIPRDKSSLDEINKRMGTKQNNVHVPVANTSTRTNAKEERVDVNRIASTRTDRNKVVPIGVNRRTRAERTSAYSDNGRLDDYVVLRVSGNHSNAFPLRELSRFMVNRDLIFDEMGLFSMLDETTKDVKFKVADVYSPGQFDPEKIETYATEGLTFIMYLAPLSNPQQSFEQMLSLASECARCFDAVVQDEHNNKLSNQTITHYRHRVAEFRRKQMSM